MAGGYTGKHCIVNLSSNTPELVEPDETFYQKSLGGYGVVDKRVFQRGGLGPEYRRHHCRINEGAGNSGAACSKDPADPVNPV